MIGLSHIAVLIACHNRRKKTIDCLRALHQTRLPEGYRLDIFLVDDGSTDGTSEAVKQEFPQVNIIQGDGNLFWNHGMRLAWETAAKTKDYDFYLWLNDDTLLFENALVIMLEQSQILDNKQILVGSACSSINRIVTYSGFKLPNIKLEPNATWQACDYFNGNIVLVPSHVYHQVGLLDNRFHHTIGDFDYGMRASKLGFKHLISPLCLGYCEDHQNDPVWRNKSIPFHKRLMHLYTPLGNNPIEFFIFDRRHNGLYIAIVHFLSIHLRSILPVLWKR